MKNINEIYTENDLLVDAAEALRDRNGDRIAQLRRRAENWLGQHDGLIEALGEMEEAAYFMESLE